MYFPADNGLLSAPPRAGGAGTLAPRPRLTDGRPLHPGPGPPSEGAEAGRPASLPIAPGRAQTRPERTDENESALRAEERGLGSPMRPPSHPVPWASQMRPPHPKGLLRVPRGEVGRVSGVGPWPRFSPRSAQRGSTSRNHQPASPSPASPAPMSTCPARPPSAPQSVGSACAPPPPSLHSRGRAEKGGPRAMRMTSEEPRPIDSFRPEPGPREWGPGRQRRRRRRRRG